LEDKLTGKTLSIARKLMITLIKAVFYILVFVLLLVMLLYIPPVQSIVADKTENILSKKLKAKVEIGALNLNLFGNLILKEIQIYDPNEVKVFEVEKIDVEISVLPLIFKKIRIHHVLVDGLRFSLEIQPELNQTNLDFIITAFKTDTTSKESESASFDLMISEIGIERSFLSMSIVDQLDLQIDIGSIKLQNKITDMNELDFKVKEIQLDDTDIRLEIENDSTIINKDDSNIIVTEKKKIQTKISPENNVSASLDDIYISNTSFVLDIDNSIHLGSTIKEFEGEKIDFDLMDHQVQAQSLELTDALIDLIYHNPAQESIPEEQGPDNSSKDFFVNDFDWNIGSKHIQLTNCEFGIDNSMIPDSDETVDLEHLKLKEINLSLNDATLTNRKLGIKFEQFQFLTEEGFALREINGDLIYENNNLSLIDLSVRTDNSNLAIDAKLTGEMIKGIMKNPDSTSIDIDKMELEISSKDLSYFNAQNVFNNSNINSVYLNTKLKGTLNNILIYHLDLTADDRITGDIQGRIRNLHDRDQVCMEDLKANILVSTSILYDILDSLQYDDIALPDKISITGEFQGCRNDLQAKVLVNSEAGEQVHISVKYRDPGKNYPADTLNLVLMAENLDVGRLIHRQEFGNIDFNIESDMYGLRGRPLQFEIVAHIDSLQINDYGADNIYIETSYVQDSIYLHAVANDSILDFDLSSRGLYSNSIYSLNSNLNIREIDLGQLGILDQSLKVSGEIKSKELISKEILNAAFEITNTKIISKNTFQFDTINVDFYKEKDSISFDIISDFLTGWFNSNIPINKMDEHLLRFYGDHLLEDSAFQNIDKKGLMQFSFASDRSFDNLILLVPGLEELNVSSIEGEINQFQNTSDISVSIPKITYQEISFDSVYINVHSEPDLLGYVFNISQISYDPYTIENFRINGQTDKGVVKNILSIQNTSLEHLLKVGFTFEAVDYERMMLQIDPDSLIVNSKIWSVLGENRISFEPGKKIRGNIHIDDGRQALQIVASDALYEINIKDFQLASLSDLLKNFDPEVDISGGLNIKSNIQIEDESIGVRSNVSIDDFVFQGTHFGNIDMDVDNEGEQLIKGKLLLKNGDNTLSVTGKYYFKQSRDPLTAQIQVDLNEVQTFKSFGKGMVMNPEGNIQGEIEVIGNLKTLITSGHLDLNTLEFHFTPLNNFYSVKNQKISIENNTFHFNEFMLLDTAGQNFKMNGSLKSEGLNRFSMDLEMDADRFSVYNVNQDQNPGFYGSLIISMDASIKGSLENPNILLNLMVDQGTDLVYALPPKNFDIMDSEGIVEFVSFSEPDSLQDIELDQYLTDTLFSKLNWIDLNAILGVDKSAQFMIDVDPVSGDYIQFGGTGNLNLLVQKDQNPRITGSYEFDRGVYEVSFYGLVKKTFEFVPGSIISWSGNPYQARLNLSSRNNIRTASIGLVSREVYGMSDEEKSKYRRTLPYSVDINILGSLDRPEIKFGIDLPEEDRSAFPLVDTKLNQLAEPGHESELTRQVFGLLTIGSFIPETTGPGAGGDYGSALATTAAANSINAILTNELNKLSGKYITFADLDIGMQTFSDMAGGGQTNRTTMDVKFSKKLFDDRVTIEAQSTFDLQNEANKYKQAADQSTVHSDFAIIYDLTEKGDYKLKAFERSAYDIIYKDTRMGGIAVIFIKEFDRYKKDRKSKE
jgi:hypothetical protein